MIDETKAKNNKELLEAATHFTFGEINISKIDNFFIVYKGGLIYNKDAKKIICEYNVYDIPENERFNNVYDALEVVKELIK